MNNVHLIRGCDVTFDKMCENKTRGKGGVAIFNMIFFQFCRQTLCI